MIYLNEYSNLISGTKISRIKSLNIWTSQGVEEYNETLLDNFSRLCRIANIKNNLSSNNFLNTLESVLFTVNDLIQEEEWNKLMNWTIGPDENTLESYLMINCF